MTHSNSTYQKTLRTKPPAEVSQSPGYRKEARKERTIGREVSRNLKKEHQNHA